MQECFHPVLIGEIAPRTLQRKTLVLFQSICIKSCHVEYVGSIRRQSQFNLWEYQSDDGSIILWLDQFWAQTMLKTGTTNTISKNDIQHGYHMSHDISVLWFEYCEYGKFKFTLLDSVILSLFNRTRWVHSIAHCDSGISWIQHTTQSAKSFFIVCHRRHSQDRAQPDFAPTSIYSSSLR